VCEFGLRASAGEAWKLNCYVFSFVSLEEGHKNVYPAVFESINAHKNYEVLSSV
jgi:hypothetical protein